MSTGRSDSRPEGLVLVSTPIGNLGDISRRALDTLQHADLLLCEDTRVTARLLSAYGLTIPTQPLHDHNEDSRIPAILERLRQGACIALVSDAGTPLVSDPGYRLVRAALAENLPVSGIPGANAAILALTLSGLAPHPYLFIGFAPPRSAARRQAFGALRAAEHAGLAASLIWYEAPHRLAGMLHDLLDIFGDRPAAVARELTKRFEEVRRGSLAELADHYDANTPRGEITVLIAPPGDEKEGHDSLDDKIRLALQSYSSKDAAAMIAAATGLPRKTVYARVLELAHAKKS